MERRWSALDRRAMRRALALAARGGERVEPNPRVGAVLVRGGRIVGEGFHEEFGGPHAEVNALAQAGPRAVGATLYVTLEPCCHWGKTPPCIDVVLGCGVREVVAAVRDPNPLVRGGGFRALRGAGMAVRTGLMAAEARAMNEPFFRRHRRGRPYVIAKWAMSLDGRMAARTGDSKWITSALMRRRARAVRDRVDAILVGVETVIADDPRLATRRRAVRVILDSRLRTPLRARVVRTARRAPTWIVSRRSSPAHERAGVRLLGRDPRDIRGLLRTLYREGIGAMLVEGGAAVLASFFDAGAVDEVVACIAPKMVGGRARVARALGLARVAVDRLGDEVIVRGRVR